MSPAGDWDGGGAEASAGAPSYMSANSARSRWSKMASTRGCRAGAVAMACPLFGCEAVEHHFKGIGRLADRQMSSGVSVGVKPQVDRVK